LIKKTILIVFLLYFSLFISIAQNIDNVLAIVQDKNIVITYNLKEAKVGQIFDIELWYSVNNGPYKKCQAIQCSDGSFNGIDPGYNKSITWIVLQDINSLECNTLDFEVRAIESNASNINAGARGNFTDNRDNRYYKWIKIGDQIIMAENLAYKPNKGNYWAYGENQENVQQYGYLYDWETAKKICPSGWHLPSKDEFEKLLDNYGGGGSNAYYSLIPGGKSGFDVLFGGQRFYAGNSLQIGSLAYFWSRDSYSSKDGWDIYIFKGHTNAGIGHYNKSSCFSVRCIKD